MVSPELTHTPHKEISKNMPEVRTSSKSQEKCLSDQSAARAGWETNVQRASKAAASRVFMTVSFLYATGN